MRRIKIPIRRPWIPYIILVISLLITVLSTMYVLRGTNQLDQLRFESAVQDTQNNINNRIEVYISLLRATTGLITSEPNISKNTFNEFVTRLSLEQNYPGIQGLGYIKKVTSEEKDTFITEEKNINIEDFHIWPDSSKETTFPIVFLEPSNNTLNKDAIGFDVSSESIRNTALHIARDTGRYAATKKVILGIITNQDVKQPGFLIYFPIYESNTVPKTLDERRTQLIGYVYAPFRTNYLFQDILAINAKHLINFQIYDGKDINPSNLLFDSNNSKQSPNSRISRYTIKRNISTANTDWTVVFTTDSQFENLSQRGLAPIILLGGLIVSFTLFLLSRAQYIARAIAEESSIKLRYSQKELQKAVGLRDNFMSIASHELKTPVTSLKVYTEVLLKNFSASKQNKATEYMQKMNKQIDKLTLLIQDLLDVSRLQAGKLAFREDSFLLSDIAQEAVENILPIAGQHQISIKGKSKKEVWGDKDRIGQVINNFLTNAIKYSPKSDKIIVTIEEFPNEVSLSVQDFGIGIDPKHLKKIFTRFYRVSDTNQLTYPGLGMGLYICHEIIKRHGGKIKVLSTVGKGSLFSFTLPYNDKIIHQ